MQKITLITILILITGALMGREKWSGEPPKPALLVIDVQKAYIGMMDQSEVKIATTYINACIDLFRESGLPVVRVYNTSPKFGPEVNSKEFEFIDEINVLAGDPMVIKTHSNSFLETDLDKILSDLEVNTIFLCGLSATGCVIASYHGGIDNFYDTYLVKNALLSPNHEQTQSIEDIFDTVTYSGLNLAVRAIKN